MIVLSETVLIFLHFLCFVLHSACYLDFCGLTHCSLKHLVHFLWVISQRDHICWHDVQTKVSRLLKIFHHLHKHLWFSGWVWMHNYFHTLLYFIIVVCNRSWRNHWRHFIYCLVYMAISMNHSFCCKLKEGKETYCS